MLRLLIWQTLVLVTALPVAFYLFGTSTALSFLMGGAVLIFSLGAYGAAFALIFKQKLVALALGIIVSKYAILGILIPKLVDLEWVDQMWFGLGFCSIVFGGLFYAIEQAWNNQENAI